MAQVEQDQGDREHHRTRLPHDRDIDWWVNDMEGDMGKSGTLSSMIAILERGGAGTSTGTNPDHMTDRHLKASERMRVVESYWLRLPTEHRRTLRCYYEHRVLPPGVREELGQLATLALTDPASPHIVTACASLHQRPTAWRTTDPGRMAMQVVKAAADRARAAVLEAHSALSEARDGDGWVDA